MVDEAILRKRNVYRRYANNKLKELIFWSNYDFFPDDKKYVHVLSERKSWAPVFCLTSVTEKYWLNPSDAERERKREWESQEGEKKEKERQMERERERN